MSLPASAARPDPAKAQAGGYAIETRVLDGIRRASAATGIDFGFLMAQAAQESGFRSTARAATSSATGLYQFIESTWLQMVRDHGARHGLSDLARKIDSNAAGAPRVGDSALRARILALRDDPQLNAALGAEYARENKGKLEEALGREVQGVDLYLAHFLGPQGAIQLLDAIGRNGGRAAADVLPKAAAANPAIFYDPEGNPRTVRELHRMMAERIDRRTQEFAATPKAAAPGSPERAAAAAPAIPAAGLPKLSLFSVLTLSAYELLTEGERERERKA